MPKTTITNIPKKMFDKIPLIAARLTLDEGIKVTNNAVYIRAILLYVKGQEKLLPNKPPEG